MNNTEFATNFNTHATIGDTINCSIDDMKITAKIIENDDVSFLAFHYFNLEDKQRWENNEWQFCGLVLSISFNGISMDIEPPLFGICLNLSCNNNHLMELANDMLVEALVFANKDLKKLRNSFN